MNMFDSLQILEKAGWEMSYNEKGICHLTHERTGQIVSLSVKVPGASSKPFGQYIQLIRIEASKQFLKIVNDITKKGKSS